MLYSLDSIGYVDTKQIYNYKKYTHTVCANRAKV